MFWVETRGSEGESNDKNLGENFLGRFETLWSFWVFSPEDLFNVDASKLESLAAKNRALNEQIARLEQEREKEPVSKHAYLQQAYTLTYTLGSPWTTPAVSLSIF